jgi:protein-tyrosine phosphatase
LIDIHCHILSNLDDGPKGFQECIDMANAAVATGISHLIATPHHLNGQFENPKEVILKHVLELNKYLVNHNIPLTLSPGQELRIHREIFISIELNEVLTIDNKGKYLLLELPSGEFPHYTHDVIYELLQKGITPILAHPERNKEFFKNHQLLFDLVQEGALMQLTAGSIVGYFGRNIKSFSELIIEHNLAHFIASDAHNTGSRGFLLQDAYEKIKKKYGIDRFFYFKENTELLIKGQHIFKEDPIPIKPKILRLFSK